MPPFFEVQNIGVTIDDSPILDSINVQFAEGEVAALLGHNGSGKSTLLKILARQNRPSTGRVLLQGQNISGIGAREFARQVSYLPQNPPMTDGLTVRELVALGRFPWRGPLGRYGNADYRCMDQAIADTGVDHLQNRSVDTLSGGERQRAWIAMLLTQQTPCLLLDEPISALDVRHQVETLRLIHGLARERGLTVVLVLHDVDLAARFCDRLLALKGSASGATLIADGTPAQIMNGATLQQIYSVPMGVMERGPEQWVSYVH